MPDSQERAAQPVNIPNLLTWTRILLIPVVVGVFYAPLSPYEKNLIATCAFIVAALTDWLDGWLARKLGQMSAFGAFLDPVADKLMVAAAVVMLVELDRADTVVAFIIIGREIAISALREWMAHIGAAKSVAVSFIGKLKTAAQMIAIPMLFYHEPLWSIPVAQLGYWLLWLAAVLTIWSMGYYLGKAWPEIRSKGF
jgi:CDP-diacylglycerol--glycerol-3-phosphate 3-phosphatidyltransferase/cardiolipin synthase